MSISRALSSANTGLNAASRRAAVVSGNVANALTPGYARREVTLNERVVGGQGAGVEVNGVRRVSDPSLTASRRLAESDSNRDAALAKGLNALSAQLGGPEDPFSFFAQIAGFQDALSSLRESPESTVGQRNVLEAGKQVANVFQQLSTENRRVRTNADGEIARQVSEVNDTLKQIESINGEIRTANIAGRDTAALEDQRQRLVDRVSSIIPIREVPREAGAVDLITNEGVFLLAGKARKVEFAATSVITDGMSLAGGNLSGLTVAGTDITPGAASGLGVGGGELAAQFAIRDEIAPEFGAQLDALAEDLIARFSDPANDPSLTGGAPGLFTDGGGALAADPAPGLASRIAVNAAVDPDSGGALWRLRDGVGATAEGVAGDATTLGAMLDGMRAPRTIDASGFSGAFSALDAAAEFTSSRAGAAFNMENRAATSAARADGLVEAEQALSAVDTDAELQNLLRIEQAYSANARVIQTVDQMLQRLLEI